MIPVGLDETLYLFTLSEKGELSFKTSRNMEYLQKETILIKGGICYTRLYHFPVVWLTTFANYKTYLIFLNSKKGNN